MANAKPIIGSQKTSKLKTLRSSLAKHIKALELAIKEGNNESIATSRQECIKIWEHYDDELYDLNMLSQEEQLEINRSSEQLKERLDGLLSQTRPRSEVEIRSALSVHSCISKSSSKRKPELAQLKLAQAKRRQELEKRQQDLENQQADIRRQLELQSLENEIELSELDENSNLGSHSSVHSSYVLPQDIEPAQERTKDYVRSLPNSVSDNNKSFHMSANNVDLLNGFISMTDRVQESLNLPKPEILAFSGNPADYCKFISNFETNIDSRVKEDSVKLSYLIQYCQGDARRSIEDCVVMPSAEGYVRAKQILKTRYGKPHLVARSHVDRLINGVPVKPNDVQGLMNLSLDMEKCQITLTQIGFVSDINNTENLRKIVRRLPVHIRSKWAERASRLIEQGSEPDFGDLLTFVQERVQVANTMYGQDLANAPKVMHKSSGKSVSRDNSRRDRVVTLNTTAGSKLPDNESPGNKRKCLSCIYCKGGHKLRFCDQFKGISVDEKLSVIRNHKMCENCLNFKHSAKFCRLNSCCEIDGCNEKHHTLLHGVNYQNVNTGSGQSNCCAAAEKSTMLNKVSLRIVPVVIEGSSGQVKTYALLDEGSDVTLCTDKLVKRLGATGRPREFTITTVNHSSERRNGLEVSLKVSPIDKSETVVLNRVWSVERLPISLSSLPDRSVLGKWSHLKGINLPRIEKGQVELLIGSDTPEVFWVEDERRGKRGEPYAIRSILGWSILGPTGKNDSFSCANVNFQHTSDVQIEIERLWETDFPDREPGNSTGMSLEDRRALSIMEGTLEKDGGHFKLGLPWRDKSVSLPNNRVMAITRLAHLKRKLRGDPELRSMYKNTMKEYIGKGYAVPVNNTGKHESGKIWYLPHHPVVNQNKPGKVRIVFDCAAKYRGTSLNDNLMQGPDFVNSLVGVLLRFREEPVALVADIEAMFHQVRVRDSDRNALRFLWWPDGDMEKEPIDHCMTVHLFGATSSPSCTGFCLKKLAKDNYRDISKEVRNTIDRNFYVDDLLKSVPDSQVGMKLCTELTDTLLGGGFRLTKWLSNDQQVMDSIPQKEKSVSHKRVDIESNPRYDRALGLQWDVHNDRFVFNVCLQEKCQTRRGILSVASSLYDPLGLVAPVTLIPKLILQNSCRQKLKWDERISDADAEKWSNWLSSLSGLTEISIDRCFKPSIIDNSTSRVELHMFSDASEQAYGSAVYLKIYDVMGHSKCSLVIGKSRLAPIKSISIPRLELAAAALSVKLYDLVSRELDMIIDERYFWTDSMIVLGYIQNEKKRFKTYVANRLAVIHETTSPKDWRYVPTKVNPADIASRGAHPHEKGKLLRWLHGPDFLKGDRTDWPEVPRPMTVDDGDSEVKMVLNTFVTPQKHMTSSLDDLLTRYSDWEKLQRCVAWLLRFKMYVIQKYSKGKTLTVVNRGTLTVNEIRDATKSILVLVQKSAYNNDIKCVTETTKVPKVSPLVKLSPVYVNGLLRVGGRLNNAFVHADAKHPVILPSNHHVTRILIRKYHEMNAHMGAHHILSLLRQKYWIVHGLQTAKSVLGKCINCKRRQQRPETQQMGQLPAERLTPDKAPFTFVGVDFFGPTYVKSGRRHLKRYGCLFTCLTTRAVHIEITHSLDTDSFVCAFQRFVSRRGQPEKVFSDNGTNLRAGERELRDSIQQWNRSRLSRYFLQKEIVWNFNPPYASHMGGVWERLVRSIKNALKSVVREQLLNDEGLSTLMTEVEKILNDRPITQVSNDSQDPEPLSPNKLLIMRSNSCVPPGLFDKDDIYCRRWWRQVQYLADVFWRRWTREYIPTLQVRQKWPNIRRNLAVNDLVLVCDDSVARGHWPLGRVLEVSEGRDGLVRSCRVKVNGTEKVRPLSRLCLLEQRVS